MEKIIPRRFLLYLLLSSFATWFMIRFDVEILSQEYLIFAVGICLISVVGGWSIYGEKEIPKEEEGEE